MSSASVSARPPSPAPPSADDLARLRAEVRAFLADRRNRGLFTPSVDAWLNEWNLPLTAALAERGWIGMTIPVEYGGHGRSPAERYVVTEELVAAGAPVGAHWVADRQIAPSILRFGSEELKHRFLPGIARGERHFSIAMSEPDCGSDLTGIRARARRDGAGWRLTGTKLWISNAHRANACVVLVRTDPFDPADRHAGLSQFIVDLPSEGVQVNPVRSASGEHHFNELVLAEAPVAAERLLGEPGRAWEQVTSELAYERSGPERFLSTLGLLGALLEDARTIGFPADPRLGRIVGRLAGLRAMSQAVAGTLQSGRPADTAAATVKVLGTALEAEVVDLAEDVGLGSRSGDSALLATGQARRAGFTLRGGTNEILRGVIARGLGMR
ncbi:MAG TPA: acyl-CoA dehydrogenase family protein [Amycolatopsis sp.]|nr:acyl-CoA dehydrogenase family protein [Amycolatopsis sp.]